jgi:hypothetical protein
MLREIQHRFLPDDKEGPIWPLFLYKTAKPFFSYISMIRLLPNTDAQTIKVLPRVNTAQTGLSLKITEDGTNKSETLTGLSSTVNGNFIDLDCTFSILSDNSIYNYEIFDGSTLLFRDKAYCTDSYLSNSVYTINDGKYTESDSGDSSQQYIMV